MICGMAFFCLLNHTNKEIRGYSWHVVSTSVVLFLAVLIGHSWQGFTALVFLPPPWERTPTHVITVGLCSMFSWHMVMQLGLAGVCGVFGKPPQQRAKTLVDLKCTATLLGLICALTNTALWGYVQSQMPQTLLGCFLVLAMAGSTLWTTFSISERTRNWVVLYHGAELVDEFKLMWKRHAVDQEDIALSITMAKLAVIYLQMWLSGFLPFSAVKVNETGVFMLDQTTIEAALSLILTSVLLACLIPFVDAVVPARFGRRRVWLKKCLGMGVAYSFLHGVEAINNSSMGSSPYSSLLAASFVTFSSFIVMFFANAAQETADTEFEGDISLVQPLSLLVGFSWADTYAHALVTITMNTHWASTAVETIVLAVAFSVLVVPAWRWHVLPNTMRKDIQELLLREQQKAQQQVAGDSMPGQRTKGKSAIIPSDLMRKAQPGRELGQLHELLERIAELEATIAEYQVLMPDVQLDLPR